jgi:methylated-DNA-[protein]-cysteine S-methyltransferase
MQKFKPIGNKFYSSMKISGLDFTAFSLGRGIQRLYFNLKDQSLSGEAIKLYPDDPFMFNVFREIEEYFNGSLKQFRVPLDLEGTEFQRKVWKEVNKIPFGQTKTYKDIALKVGGLSSVRAVGRAVGANPVPLIIPCHRVIDTLGNLRGYSAGLFIKEMLLEHEGFITLELFNEM